jgi:hypothetical protein
MSTTAQTNLNAPAISGVAIPDSKLVREATKLVRDSESELLFNHSTRVFYFGSLAGQRRGVKFDPELLYIGAMFHDIGLTPRYSSQTDWFEVDGPTARALSCVGTTSPSDTWRRSGWQLRCTPRPA